MFDSLSMPAEGIFLHSIVQNCGRERVQLRAKYILTNIDSSRGEIAEIGARLMACLASGSETVIDEPPHFATR